ncbi:MAG TPA: hypothetical protein VGR31_00425 [Planctomycetota bacterium]|nr:hypothetical protein [Planctomycetota bacterium]
MTPRENPEALLRKMCLQHGLPPDYAIKLIPVVRRAMESPDEIRERILAMVEGNLAQHAADRVLTPPEAKDPDDAVLLAVARLMHHWTPSESALDPDSGFGGLDLGEIGGA